MIRADKFRRLDYIISALNVQHRWVSPIVNALGIIVKKTKDKTIASPHIVINYVYTGDVFKYTGDVGYQREVF